MDIALTIHSLIDSAKYEGSVSDNLKSSYDAIRWLDDRPKPTWEELQNAWILLEQQIANKKRIAELKQLLVESDYRMTSDYYESMSVQDKEFWTSERQKWRSEVRTLETN